MNTLPRVKKRKGKKMKKIFLTMIALLCMTTAFAMNEAAAPEATNVAAYDLNININRLSDALNLTNDQKEAVENIYNMFNTEMSYATQYSSSEREIMVKRAIDTDVKHMSYVLNDEQMSKYMAILNATIKNRGIIK